MQKSTQKIKIIDKKAVNKRLTKLSHLFTAFFLLIALISAPINFVQSAFNPEINYQGKLTDSAGVGVTDGDYNMEFKLYTVSSGGTAIWTETLTLTNKVTVASGLFSVLLGNITSIAGVDFNQDLYLGVNIGGTGTASWDGEMTPRKQIASVPSAFEADQLDGLDSTQFLRSDEADTMSASSASTLLSVVQSGVGNILSLFDGATEVFTVKDGGNVGIGTTSPSSLLHLRSSNPIQYITSDNTGQSSIYFGGASDSDAGRIIYSDNDDSLRISTNNSEALRILNSGNVGIGITSPSAKLDVDGATLIRNSLTVADTTTKAYSSFGSNSTSHGLSSIQDVLFSGDVEIDGDLFLDASTIEFAQASTTGDFQIGGVLLASDGTALSPSYTFTADTDTGLFRAGINALGITTAGSEALRVDANGNIGIGTTAPGTKLDIGDDTASTLQLRRTDSAIYSGNILGTINFGGDDPTATNLGATIQAIADDTWDTDQYATYLEFKAHDGVSLKSVMTLKSGNVGIGTTVPRTLLELSKTDGADALSIYAQFGHIQLFESGNSDKQWDIDVDNGILAFSEETASPKERLVIQNDTGNVGIGTTAPEAKLHTFSSYLNPSLTSNASSGLKLDSIGPQLSVGISSGAYSWLQTSHTSVDSQTYPISLNPLGGNVGIGSTTPAQKLSVDGIIYSGTGGFQLPDGTIIDENSDLVGPLTHTQTFVGNSSGVATATSTLTILDSGNVGIGTASPGALLAVSGIPGTSTTVLQKIGGFEQAVGNYAGVLLGGASTVANIRYKGGIVFEPTGEAYSLGKIHILNDNTGDNSDANISDARITILPDGNVGIGTTAPLVKTDIFDVNKTNSTNLVNLGVRTSDTATIDMGGTIGLGGNFTSTTGVVYFGSIRGAKENSTASNYDGYLAFQTVAHGGVLSEKMRITSEGNVGIGTTAPSAKLEISGGSGNLLHLDGTSNVYLEIDRSGADRQGHITFSTAGVLDWTTGVADTDEIAGSPYYFASGEHTSSNAKMVIEKGGNVGIGDTSPSYKLDVSGDIGVLSGNVVVQTTGKGMIAGTSDGSDNQQVVIAGGGAGSSSRGGVLLLSGNEESTYGGNVLLNPGVNTGAQVRIDNTLNIGDGNVGIGTTSPDTLLHVVGGAGGIDIAKFDRLGLGSIKFNVAGSEPQAVFEAGGTDQYAFGYDTAGGFVISESGVIGTNDRFYIKDGGNVGIGTVSPTYKLDVVGNIGLDQYLHHNDDTDTFFNFDEDRVRMSVGNVEIADFRETAQNYIRLGYYGDVDIDLGNGSIFVEGSSGNVGIGTTTPTGLLHLVGGNVADFKGLVIDSDKEGSDIPFRIRTHYDGGGSVTDADTKFIVTGLGNVGIGTTAPGATLDVRGDAIFNEAGEDNNFRIEGDTITNLFSLDAGNDSIGIAATAPSSNTLDVGETFPTVTSSGTNYSKVIDIQANDLSIASGITDSGYRIGLGVQGFTDDADFQGTLAKQYGIWSRVGSNTTDPTGTITNSYAIYLENLDGGATVTNKYGLYQSSTSAKNYFGGDVGIGTTDPGAKLDILESGNSGNQLRVYDDEGTTPSVRTYSTSDGYGLILNSYYAESGSPYERYGDIVVSSAGIEATEMRFFTKALSANPTEAVRIDSAGNVGIGTTAPDAKLQVGTVNQSSNYSTGLLVYGGDGGAGSVIANLMGYSGTSALKIGGTGDFNINSGQMFVDQSTGNVGIGSTTPAQKLSVDGIIYSGTGGFQLPDGTIIDENSDLVGPLTHTQTFVGNSSGVATATSTLTVLDSGNVGIGTVSPLSKLHVEDVGGSSVTPTLTLSQDGGLGLDWNAGALNFYSRDDSITSIGGIGGIRMYAETAYNTEKTPSYMTFYTHDNTPNDGSLLGDVTEQMRIDASGNVGIGTTAPSGKLTIYDTVSGAPNPQLKLGYDSTHDYTIGRNTGSGALEFTGSHATQTGFHFYTPSTEIMTMLNSGNVGIGTTAPQEKLHVYNATGNIFSEIETGDGSQAWLKLTNSEGSGAIYEDANSMRFFQNAGTRMTIDSSGNVGIGTTAPNQKLQIQDGNIVVDGAGYIGIDDAQTNSIPRMGFTRKTGFNTVLAIGSATDFNIAVSDGTNIDEGGTFTNLLTVEPLGNVGIGTTAPDSKLHIYKGVSGGTAFAGYSTLILENSETNIFQMLSPSTSVSGIMFGDEVATNPGYIRYSHIDDSMRLWTSGSEQMVIDTSGNVGIGTTAPGAKLEINSDNVSIAGLVVDSERTGGGGAMQVLGRGLVSTQDISGGYGLYVIRDIAEAGSNPLGNFIDDNTANTQTTLKVQQDGTGDIVNLFDGVTEVFTVLDGGNVGIGTTTPLGPLHVAGNSGGLLYLGDSDADANKKVFRIVSDSGTFSIQTRLDNADNPGNSGNIFTAVKDVNGDTDYLALHTGNGDERVRIDDDGDVGIGTTAPGGSLSGTTFHLVSAGDTFPISRIERTGGSTKTNRAWETFIGSTGSYVIRDATTTNNPVYIEAGAPSDAIGIQADGDVILAEATGNVGIGTTAPTHQLDIESDGYAKLRLSRTGANAGAWDFSITNATSGGVGTLRITPSVSTADFDITSNGAVSRFFVDTSSGNVGIGNDSPGSPLDVINNTAGVLQVAHFTHNQSSVASSILLENSAGGDNSEFDINFKTGASGISAKIGVIRTNSPSAGDTNMFFSTTAGEAMRIDSSGNVGIGTTDPGAKLDVEVATNKSANIGLVSSSGIADYSEGNAYLGFSRSSDGSNNISGIYSYGNVVGDSTPSLVLGSRSELVFATGGSGTMFEAEEAMRIDSSGNVGIGSTTPAQKLSVDGIIYSGTGGFQLPDGTIIDENNDLVGPLTHTQTFVGNSSGVATATSTLTVLDSGNVGIGTASPKTRLHIANDGVGDADIPALGYSDDSTDLLLTNDNTNYGLLMGAVTSGDGWVQVQRTDGTATAYDLLLQPNGGNVGIGTTDPGAKLDVSGNVYVEHNNTDIATFKSTVGTSARILVDSSVSGDTQIAFMDGGSTKWSIGNDATNDSLKFMPASGTFAGSEVMTVLSTGSVGIGTTAPGAKLEIKDLTDISTADHINYPLILMSQDTGGDFWNRTGVGIQFENTASSGSFVSAEVIGRLENTTGNRGELLFKTNEDGVLTNQMLIGSDGNVGIGTTDPVAKLDVVGNIIANGNRPITMSGGAGNIYIQGSAGGWADFLHFKGFGGTDRGGFGGLGVDDSLSYLYAGDSYSSPTMVWKDGNVGIGTTAPLVKLSVVNSSSGSLTEGFLISNPNSASVDTGIGIYFDPNGASASTPSTARAASIVSRQTTTGNYADLGFFTAPGGTPLERMTIDTSGNVGIGTTDPGANLEVDGGINNNLALFSSSDSDTFISLQDDLGLVDIRVDGGQLEFDVGGTVDSMGSGTNAMTIDTSGNVGIGTDSPAYKLDVYGSSGGSDLELLRLTNASSVGTVGSQLLFETYLHGGNSRITGRSVPTSSYRGTLQLETRNTDQGWNLGLLIDESGNVGIGTTAPEAPLHIKDSSFTELLVDSTGANDAFVMFAEDGVDETKLGWDASANAFKINVSSPSFALSDFVVTESGNVGIGTTAPGAKLEVKSSGNSSIVINAEGSHGNNLAYVYQDGDGDGIFYVNDKDGTIKNRIYSNGDSYFNGGNVGIGTTSPDSILNLVSADPVFLIKDTETGASLTNVTLRLAESTTGGVTDQFYDINLGASGKLSFIDNFSDVGGIGTRMVIDGAGNVGIGTTAPSAKLDIGDDTASTLQLRRTDSAIYSGNILGTINFGGDDPTATNLGATIQAIADDTWDTDQYATYLEFKAHDGVSLKSVMTLKSGNVGIGTTAPDGKLEVYGAGQLVSDLTDAGSRDNMLMINSSGTSGGSGGALVFGNSQSKTADSLGWAAIKAHLTNGSGNTVGNLTFSTRNSTSDTALTQRMTILSGGNIGIGVSSPSQQLEITGDFELPNTTHADESGIIYKGTSPFIHNFNYGDNGSVTTVGGNTFVGVDSGNFTMGSTAVSALSASYNTGVGEDSLKSLTLGYGNTASGYNSLASNTTGSLNSALGYYALFDNTTGNYNTGVGTESLANNTIGDSNTAIGNNSLWNNVDGSNNSALGHSALVGNEDGDLNIAIGYDAGHYYGDYAMSNTSGNKNIYLGVQTKSAGYDKENEIVIGYTAEGIGSNSVVLGNESITTTALRGNVGIGTTDPGAKTEIYQAMSDYGSAFTSPHLNLGASNTVDNTGFVGITYDTSATANYGWSSGALRSSSGQGDFVWKFHSASAVGSELMRITSTGNVGIGTTDPVSVLHIKDTTWTNLSIEATSDDPSLQLTSDGSGTSNDWTMRMDVSDSDKLQWRYDGTKKLTITSPGQLIMTNDNWLSADNNAGTDYVNMFKVNTSDEIDVGATLNVGAMEFSEDSGFVTAMDMPVSSTPTAGDIEAYAFKVDGDNILTVYAEADGAGGIQNARVGIGDSSPSYQLELSTDSAAKPGTSSWTVSSDERLKDVNGDFTRGLDALSGLYPSYFNYKTDNDLGIPSDREYVGLIAQDVQSVIPEAVREGKEGFLSIESDAIFWTMLNAIKEIGLKVGSDNITYTRDTLQVLNGTGEPQMKLAYDEENLAEFNVSAVGDLSLSTAGKDIRLPDDNLSVCSGGACSSAASLIEGTGNLVVENVAYIAGSLGVGTAQPSRGLDVYESQSDPQFRISYDDDLYSEFNVSATGDLIISAEGGDISVLNENLRVCSDEGCPSIASQIKDSGNLVVENSLLALGNVGIGGTISPDYTLDVQGTLRAYGITDASDARLKTNIQPLIHLGVAPPSEGISATLENVKKLRGVTFEWKNEDFGTGIQIGMIAQELEEVYPDLVSTDDSGFKSIQYGKFTAVLLEAVKDLINFGEKIEYRSARLENRTAELEEKNIELEKQAESLEQKTQTLEARIEALENILRQ